jgi:hypothetical protein
VLGTLAEAADVRGLERRERPLGGHGVLASVGVEERGLEDPKKRPAEIYDPGT